MQAVLLALPAAWRAVAQSAPPAPAWVHASTTASTHQMLLHPLTGQLHQVGADHRLQPVPAVAFTAMAPAQVVAWDLLGPGGVQHISQHSQQLPYTPRASCGVQPTCHMGFGAGAHSQLISSLSNMPASACVSFRPLLPGILSALKAWTCRPRLLPQPGSHQTPAQVLQLMEARWVSSLQSSSQGTVRPRSDEPDTQPTWMLPVQAPRLHWSQRQHQRSEQLQQHQDMQSEDVLNEQLFHNKQIVDFFSADSDSGMFRQSPTDSSAQHALLSSLDRQLPLTAQQSCEGPEEGITLEELHTALRMSARGKKPGSDGLPYEFYSQFWDLLGPELLAVLHDSFQHQHSLPASMTQGVISLLYKGKGSHLCLTATAPSRCSTQTTSCWPKPWPPALGLPCSM